MQSKLFNTSAVDKSLKHPDPRWCKRITTNYACRSLHGLQVQAAWPDHLVMLIYKILDGPFCWNDPVADGLRLMICTVPANLQVSQVKASTGQRLPDSSRSSNRSLIVMPTGASLCAGDEGLGPGRASILHLRGRADAGALLFTKGLDGSFDCGMAGGVQVQGPH